MRKFFAFLYHRLLTLIIVLFIGFLFSFVTIELINQQRSYYESTIYIENIENFDDSLLIDKDFLNSIKDSASKYENIDVEAMLNKNDFSYTKDGNTIIIKTKYKYYDLFFLSSNNTVGTRAKTFIKDSVLTIAGDKCVVSFQDENNIVTLKKNVNRWWFSLYGVIATLFLEIFVGFIYFRVNKNKLHNDIVYDNETIFNNCFHKNYWKLAFKPLIKVKDISTLAMLFALMMVCKLIPIPSGFGNLGLSFTFLFFATIALIYGPVYGFIIGIFSDIIGYFMPNGGGGMFNLGYTLQAALSGMIYGVSLFKTKVTFSKVLFARFLINIFMNAIYGSFLFIFVTYVNNDPTMTFASYLEKVKYYCLLLSLPKNVFYLLPQSILLYYVLKAILPILVRFKLVDKRLLIHKTKNDKVFTK